MLKVDLSFAVITYERPDLLRRCLASLGPVDARFEICVLFNGRDDRNFYDLRSEFPHVRFWSSAKLSRGEARNRLAALTKGRIVYFIDDDAYAPPGFASRVIAAFAAAGPSTGCIGGPNVGAADATAFQRAVDFLLQSPLGAGPMRSRYGAGFTATERVASWKLTLCSLGVRRRIFENGILFPVDCASAEENLFLYQVERAGEPVRHDPGLLVYHRRRATLRGFVRQCYQSGRGRIEVARVEFGTLHPIIFAPFIFTVFCALSFIFGRSLTAALLLASYASAIMFETARLALRGDLRAALRLPAAILSGHFGYASGTAAGIFSTADEPVEAGAPVS